MGKCARVCMIFLLLTGFLGDPTAKPLTVAQFRELTHRCQTMEKPMEERELEEKDLLALGCDQAFAHAAALTVDAVPGMGQIDLLTVLRDISRSLVHVFHKDPTMADIQNISHTVSL